jgi:hypothetical protein
MPAYRAYDPLNTVKPVADDIWIVDGPEIEMRYLGFGLPFPTRMTIVRLPSGQLWLHSPIAPDEGLVSTIRGMGDVAWLIAPSTLHYWYLPDWQALFPQARSFAPAALRGKARRALRIDEVLQDAALEAWRGSIDQCLVSNRLLTEVDFFHEPSRTLILTDLIENFEADRVPGRCLRCAIRLGGAVDPDGKAPYDMQFSFLGHRRELRQAVRRMIGWAPERIILAHGRWYPRDGVAELERAFRWVL